MDQDRHLRPTRLLDYQSPAIQQVVRAEGWAGMTELVAARAIYTYVRDRVAFGYNEADDLPASRVLADGYGQCNTKAVLLMALLRACGLACRIHGATIDKRLQKGVLRGLFYRLAPRELVHSWVEVELEGRWTALEGVILDDSYLRGVQTLAPPGTRSMLGWGVGTDALDQAPHEWTGSDTFIQLTGVRRDLGVFDDPDAFYAKVGSNLSGVKRWLYMRWIRHLMNRNVAQIRGCHSVPLPSACEPGRVRK